MAVNGALLRHRVLLGVTDTVEGCQSVIQVLCLRVTSPGGLHCEVQCLLCCCEWVTPPPVPMSSSGLLCAEPRDWVL